MRKYKILPLVALVMLSTGCSTIKQATDQSNSTKKSSPDALVGLSVSEQLERTEKELNDQIVLLNTLNQGEKITSYNLVTHNNNLDARANSTNTLPIQYGQQEVPLAKGIIDAQIEKQQQISESVEVKISENVQTVKSKESDPVLNKKVKRISWNNDSLNNLSKNIAKSIGYEFVTKEGKNGIADVKLTFEAENLTVSEMLKKLTNEVKNQADVLVFEENKTINVLYK